MKQEQSGPFELSKPSPNSSPDDKLDKIIQNAAGSGEASPPEEQEEKSSGQYSDNGHPDCGPLPTGLVSDLDTIMETD